MNTQFDKNRFKVFQKTVIELLGKGLAEDSGHALNTLQWLLHLESSAAEGLCCAALAHDLERAVDPRISRRNSEGFKEYKQRHAERSAQIVAPLLLQSGYSDQEIADICKLIQTHESENANPLLRDADLISFFDYNLPIYLDRHGTELTEQRILENLSGASQRARKIINGLEFSVPIRKLYQEALQKLKKIC